MEKETLMRIGVMLEHISELVRKKEEIKSHLSEEITEDIRMNPENYSDMDEESLQSLGIDTKSIKDAKSESIYNVKSESQFEFREEMVEAEISKGESVKSVLKKDYGRDDSLKGGQNQDGFNVVKSKSISKKSSTATVKNSKLEFSQVEKEKFRNPESQEGSMQAEEEVKSEKRTKIGRDKKPSKKQLKSKVESVKDLSSNTRKLDDEIMNEIEKVEDEIPKDAFNKPKTSKRPGNRLNSSRNPNKGANDGNSNYLGDSFNSEKNFEQTKRNFNKNKKDAEKKSDPTDKRRDNNSQNRLQNKENLRTPSKRISPFKTKQRTPSKTPDIKKSPYYQRPRPPPDELRRFRDGLPHYSNRKINQQDNEDRIAPEELRQSIASEFRLDWQPNEHYMALGDNIYDRSMKLSKENKERRQELYLAKKKKEEGQLRDRPEILKSSKKMTEDKPTFMTKVNKEIEELREENLKRRDQEFATEGSFMTTDDITFQEENKRKGKSVSKIKPSQWDHMYKTSMKWLNNKDKQILEKKGQQVENNIGLVKDKPDLLNSEFTNEIVQNKRIKENKQDIPVHDRLYRDAEIIKKYKMELIKEYDKILQPFQPNVIKPIVRPQKKNVDKSSRKSTTIRSMTPNKIARDSIYINHDYPKASTMKGNDSTNVKDKDYGEIMQELNELRSVLNEVYKKQDSGKKSREVQPKNLRGIDEIQVNERDRKALERLILNFDEEKMREFTMSPDREQIDASQEPFEGELHLEEEEA